MVRLVYGHRASSSTWKLSANKQDSQAVVVADCCNGRRIILRKMIVNLSFLLLSHKIFEEEIMSWRCFRNFRYRVYSGNVGIEVGRAMDSAVNQVSCLASKDHGVMVAFYAWIEWRRQDIIVQEIICMNIINVCLCLMLCIILGVF